MNDELKPIRKKLLALSRAEPFEPFRIKLINGDGHNIPAPQTLVILQKVAWVYSADQHWVVFPIVRINSIESLISDFIGDVVLKD